MYSALCAVFGRDIVLYNNNLLIITLFKHYQIPDLCPFTGVYNLNIKHKISHKRAN